MSISMMIINIYIYIYIHTRICMVHCVLQARSLRCTWTEPRWPRYNDTNHENNIFDNDNNNSKL